jgi:hypothetical protein
VNKLIDEDVDVTPVDDDGNNLPNQSVHLENDAYDEDKECVSITEDMFDPTNHELACTAEVDDEIIPQIFRSN